MTWHIITQIGTADTFTPAISPAEPRINVGIARADDSWAVNNDVLASIYKQIGRFPSSSAIDLLHLALAVYAADLEIPRKLFQNGWTRDFTLYLPVSDPARWEAVNPLLVRLLSYLTGDEWEIVFRRLEHFAPQKPERFKSPSLRGTVDRVALFSGGLDSLVGAIEFLERGQTVALAGHYGKGKTNGFQQRVFASLSKQYGEKAVEFMFYAQPPKQKREGEQSMRSRSILFLSLGINVASALASGLPLAVSENGLISLNVPLTNSRLGSFSTRTTHPHFLGLFRELLKSLDLQHSIETLYRFHTKGEMLTGSANPKLLAEAAKLSMSCSHPEAGRFDGKPEGNHCGYCVPCIIRRASMKAANLEDAPYDLDVLSHPPASSTGKGEDLRAFQMAIERFAGSPSHEALFRVLATGCLPPDSASEYAAVFSRGMEELGRFLMPGRYDGKRVTSHE